MDCPCRGACSLALASNPVPGMSLSSQSKSEVQSTRARGPKSNVDACTVRKTRWMAFPALL